MNWFRRGEVERGRVEALEQRVAKLTDELHATQSALRTLELEQSTMHDQVRKWMRRGVAEARNQERARTAAPSERPQPPSLWGAAARIASRKARESIDTSAASAGEASTDEPQEESNGVHPSVR